MSGTEVVSPRPLAGRIAAARRGPHRGPSLPAGLLIMLLLVGFAAVWLVELACTSFSPPVDNIEQLIWVRSLEWGYYKHPPLPTWLMWLPARVLGISATTSYLLGAAVTLGAMALFWRLLRERRGTTCATLALLGGLCITFYNGRLYYYNHNVVLLLAVVASAACCARAFERRTLRWWAATGVVLGLGALTKYQIVVTVACVVGLWLTQRAWRDPVHVRGVLLATLIALVLVSPHLLWLSTHGFTPFHYAVDSSYGADLRVSQRMASTLLWEADQLLNRALPAWLLLATCALAIARQKPTPAAPRPADCAPDLTRALLVCWGVLPLILMPALSLAFGTRLQTHWGTPFLLFAVAAAMELKPAAFWNRLRWPVAAVAFVAIQSLLLLVNYVTSPIGLAPFKDSHWRTYPSKPMTDAMADLARTRLGGPIRVVAGSVSEAGALAMSLPELPLVLLDGRQDISPWVPRDLVRRCGAVELLRNPAEGSDALPVGAVPGLFWRVMAPADHSGNCHGTGLEFRRLKLFPNPHGGS